MTSFVRKRRQIDEGFTQLVRLVGGKTYRLLSSFARRAKSLARSYPVPIQVISISVSYWDGQATADQMR